MGSVKDLEVLKKSTKNDMGIARFHFSDRYSVFDWGEMPDLIEGKGAALCLMGAYCFESLKERGIETHYRGLVARGGKLLGTDELLEPVDVMEIDLVNVLHPIPYAERENLKYDYSMFTPNLINFLIPLEIIYRNGLPDGSSVFKRLERGLRPEDMGLDHYPKPGEKLSKPIFDVSTKLEKKDRYVTWKEAKEIACLSDKDVDEIGNVLRNVDETITGIASKAGLENEDGKIELAFDDKRRLMVVDVVGTLDECRFTYGGLHVSKEIARRYYRGTDWYEDVEGAKRAAEAKRIEDWRTQCKSQPPNLDPQLRKLLSEVYMSTANEFIGRRLFAVSRFLEVIRELNEYMVKMPDSKGA
jgi:phosphoribosylaminoimidazole-succinocarboxamide synthase